MRLESAGEWGQLDCCRHRFFVGLRDRSAAFGSSAIILENVF